MIVDRSLVTSPILAVLAMDLGSDGINSNPMTEVPLISCQRSVPALPRRRCIRRGSA